MNMFSEATLVFSSIRKLLPYNMTNDHRELLREFDPLNSRVTLDYHIIELEN